MESELLDDLHTFPIRSLCAICQKVLSTDPRLLKPAKPEYREEYTHHETWASFQDSVDIGCYVCTGVNSMIDPETKTGNDPAETPVTAYMIGRPNKDELPFSTINIRVLKSSGLSFGYMYRFEGKQILTCCCFI